jgi:hypothetical protein
MKGLSTQMIETVMIGHAMSRVKDIENTKAFYAVPLVAPGGASAARRIRKYP